MFNKSATSEFTVQQQERSRAGAPEHRCADDPPGFLALQQQPRRARAGFGKGRVLFEALPKRLKIVDLIDIPLGGASADLQPAPCHGSLLAFASLWAAPLNVPEDVLRRPLRESEQHIPAVFRWAHVSLAPRRLVESMLQAAAGDLQAAAARTHLGAGQPRRGAQGACRRVSAPIPPKRLRTVVRGTERRRTLPKEGWLGARSSGPIPHRHTVCPDEHNSARCTVRAQGIRKDLPEV
mmetsp:Transcript_26659/g.65706  ORF Transcript_26659/g.65706 Transcript_26659/m.65706 type:complete len:237 (+) Transcript_26659:37-747(+)